MTEICIILTSVGALASLGVIESLGRTWQAYYIAGTDMQAEAKYSHEENWREQPKPWDASVIVW